MRVRINIENDVMQIRPLSDLSLSYPLIISLIEIKPYKNEFFIYKDEEYFLAHRNIWLPEEGKPSVSEESINRLMGSSLGDVLDTFNRLKYGAKAREFLRSREAQKYRIEKMLESVSLAEQLWASFRDWLYHQFKDVTNTSVTLGSSVERYLLERMLNDFYSMRRWIMQEFEE